MANGWISEEDEKRLKDEYEQDADNIFSNERGFTEHRTDENDSRIYRFMEELKDKFSNTIFIDAITGFQTIYKKNKYILLIIATIAAIIAGFVIIRGFGSLYKLTGHELNNEQTFHLLKIFFPLGLMLFIVFNIIAWAVSQVIYKRAYHDDERDYNIAKTGEYGTAKWINDDKKEFYETFNTGTNISKIKDDIYGRYKEQNDELVCLSNQIKGLNKNLLCVGSPGCGKSAAFVNNKVFQSIKRGESCIITDSKGAIYAETASTAIANGYKIKILNLTSKGLVHSDSCSFLKFVGKDDSAIMQLAKTIIRNTTDGKGDFWSDSEYNLLHAAIAFVVFSETIPEEEKTIGYVYQNIIAKPEKEISSLFSTLPVTHPAYGPYQVYANGNDTVRGNTLAGLGIRLSIFANPTIQKITGYDDIDLLAPGREKCIFYVIIPDQDNTFNFIATMFFALLFITLVGDADDRVDDGQRLQVAVNIILDEFFSTGAIEGFEKKIATVRSRRISIAIILQDIGQLIEMYGQNIANSIMGGCSIKMLLATNDLDTATYFSTLLGTQTIWMQNKRYTENAFDPFKIHPSYQITEGLGKRPLMNPDEIMNELDSDELLLIVSGRHPAKLKKFFFQEHTMYEKDKSKKLRANTNYPKWKREEDQRNEKIKKRAESLKAQKTPPVSNSNNNQGKPGINQQQAGPENPKKRSIRKRLYPDGHYEMIDRETGELIGIYNKDGTKIQ